jgi:hypothetical protein
VGLSMKLCYITLKYDSFLAESFEKSYIACVRDELRLVLNDSRQDL